MKQFISKIQSAFDTHSKGFSARKLTAFTIVLCVFVAHIAWIKTAFIKEDFSLLEGILLIAKPEELIASRFCPATMS